MGVAACDYSFSFHPQQRERFRTGALVSEWRQRHDLLFDERDEDILRTEHQRKYHFYEWLAAILLFESAGYRSLVEKYTAVTHPSKRTTLREHVEPPVYDWLCANESGQPDLFVYRPNGGDWFLCEVKGPGDRVRRNQSDWVARFTSFLRSQSLPHERRVRVLRLREATA